MSNNLPIPDYILETICKHTNNPTYAYRYILLLLDKKNKYTEGENHHILPKSLFPFYDSDPNNFILVPPRLHFILHMMLTKVFDTQQMWNAIDIMSKTRDGVRLTSRQFESIKIKNYEFHNSVISSKNGTHKWLGENNPIVKSSKLGLNPSQISSRNGTHHWIGDNNPSTIAIANGTHHWLDYDNHPAVVASRNGTHHWINVGQNHHHCFRKPWKNNNSSAVSKLIWSVSDEITPIFIEFPDLKIGRLTDKVNVKLDTKKRFSFYFSRDVIETMRRYFKDGWNPLDDPEWLDFKSSYNYKQLEVQI
jgi:hypothetical protein